MKVSKTPRMILKARRMKAKGASYSEIAKAFSLSSSAITNWLSNKSVPLVGPCSICGATDRRFSRHHTDYINNTVIIVCTSCHTKIHLKSTLEARRRSRAAWMIEIYENTKPKKEPRICEMLKRYRVDFHFSFRDAADNLGMSLKDYRSFEGGGPCSAVGIAALFIWMTRPQKH